jgi:hypothetical protein
MDTRMYSASFAALPHALPGRSGRAPVSRPPGPGSGGSLGSGSPGGRGGQGGEELVPPGRVVQDVPCQLLDPAGELGVEVG